MSFQAVLALFGEAGPALGMLAAVETNAIIAARIDAGSVGQTATRRARSD